MAINFPNSPQADDTWTDPNGIDWIYNGIGWTRAPAPLGTVTPAPDPPLNPAVGDLWVDSDDMSTYVWYDDGDSQQWTLIASVGAAYGGKAYIDVADYGFVEGGDISTNTGAIQAALDAAGLAGSGVLLRPLIHEIDNMLTVPAGASLIGVNATGCEVRCTTAGSGITFDTVNRVGRVGNFAVNGNDIATTCVTFDGGTHVMVDSLRIRNAAGTGLLLDGLQNSVMVKLHITDCGVEAIRITGDARNTDFVNCGVRTGGTNGVVLENCKKISFISGIYEMSSTLGSPSDDMFHLIDADWIRFEGVSSTVATAALVGSAPVTDGAADDWIFTDCNFANNEPTGCVFDFNPLPSPATQLRVTFSGRMLTTGTATRQLDVDNDNIRITDKSSWRYNNTLYTGSSMTKVLRRFGNDTGWRDIRSELTNSWTADVFMVRRVDGRVFVYFENLNTAGSSNNLWSVPAGFQKSSLATAVGMPMWTASPVLATTQTLQAMLVTGNLQANRTTLPLHATPNMSWPTDDAWPTTLPGVAS